MNEDEVRSKWPLHWLVWNDDSVALNRLLAEKEVRLRSASNGASLTCYHIAANGVKINYEISICLNFYSSMLCY